MLRTYQDIPFPEVDRRVRFALKYASQAAGPKARWLMDKALKADPSPNGVEECKAFYGDKLGIILALLDPMIVALNNGMPGFSEWLDRTGYGNDCNMIRALVAWLDDTTGTVGELIDVSRRMHHPANALH